MIQRILFTLTNSKVQKSLIVLQNKYKLRRRSDDKVTRTDDVKGIIQVTQLNGL